MFSSFSQMVYICIPSASCHVTLWVSIFHYDRGKLIPQSQVLHLSKKLAIVTLPQFTRSLAWWQSNSEHCLWAQTYIISQCLISWITHRIQINGRCQSTPDLWLPMLPLLFPCALIGLSCPTVCSPTLCLIPFAWMSNEGISIFESGSSAMCWLLCKSSTGKIEEWLCMSFY